MTMTIRATFVLLAMLFSSGIVSAQDTSNKTEDRLYRASQAMLIGGLTVDMVSTVQALGNPQEASYRYCVDGTMTCSNPNSATSIAIFNEVGWASKVGAQHPVAVVAANVALVAGVLTISHVLYEHGGRVGRVAAIALNMLQAGGSFAAGIGNTNKMQSSRLTLVPAGAFSVSWK